MTKRIIALLLAVVLTVGLCANVFAAEPEPAVSQKVVSREEDGVTVQVSTRGGEGSGNGRMIYRFPEALTLKSAKSLIGSEGVSDLTTTDTSVSFAWARSEDYADKTAVLELSFAGETDVYSVTIELPETGEKITGKLDFNAPFKYKDVSDSQWYADYVNQAYELGLMNGIGEGKFGPSSALKRGELALLLYRMAGEPEVEGAIDFTDVAANWYYTVAILWANQNGIVNGFPDGTFKPEQAVSRQDAATMFGRYIEYSGLKLDKLSEYKGFTDENAIASYAKDAVKLCVEAGILNGYPEGNFLPNNSILRGEAAKMIVCVYWAMENAKNSDKPTPPTTDPTEPTEPVEPEEGFTVTFVGEDGYAKVDGKKVESYTLPLGDNWLNFTLHGDKDQGYELDNVVVTGGKLSRNGSEFILSEIKENVTVSFTTKMKNVTVKFVSAVTSGVKIDPTSVTVPWGSLIEEPTATRSAHSVIGWYTEKALIHQFDFSKPVYEDMTLWVKWQSRQVYINYYVDDDVLWLTAPIEYNVSTLPADAPTKEGYRFAGWFEKDETTGEMKIHNFMTRMKDDLKLYAGWIEDDSDTFYVYLGGNDQMSSGRFNTNYGACGDDANDGSSISQAVRTFERAKEIAMAHKDQKVIILICGLLPITENATWTLEEFADAKVMRNIGVTTQLIQVRNGATLTLHDITIDGGGEYFPAMVNGNTCGAMLDLKADTNLVLNSGTTVQNCIKGFTCSAIYGNGRNNIVVNEGVKIINNSSAFTGGIIASSGCVTVNGGLFENNVQTNNAASYECYGAALACGTGTQDQVCELIINGGVFRNNRAAIGSAVSAYQYGNLVLNGGEIYDNVTDGTCGGVYIGAAVNSTFKGTGTLTLKKCKIYGNTSTSNSHNAQIVVSKTGQLVFSGLKDAVEIDGTVYHDYANGAVGINVARPLSNIKGGKLNVYVNDPDFKAVLLRGFNRHKVTEEDVAAYNLLNVLPSQHAVELDTAKDEYHLKYVSKYVKGVFIGNATQRAGSYGYGNDANDGLTPMTAVGSVAKAKEILAQLIENDTDKTGPYAIYVVGTVQIGENETIDLTLGDMAAPCAFVRWAGNDATNPYTGSLICIKGNATVHDLVVDNNRYGFVRTVSMGYTFYITGGANAHFTENVTIDNTCTSGGIFYIASYKKDTKVTTVVVDDLTLTNQVTFTTSSTESTGASLFYMLGSGTGKLVVNHATSIGNECRLLYVTGVDTRDITINDVEFRDNRSRGAGAIFLITNSSNDTNHVVNINGGTYVNNRCIGANSTLGAGGIALIQADAEVNFNGGTFVDNGSNASEMFSGLVIRGPKKNTLKSEVNWNIAMDIVVYIQPYNKTTNNAALVISKPLTNKIKVYDYGIYNGFVVIKGTDSYKLTEADLAKVEAGFTSATKIYTLALDTEKNAIVIKNP